MRYYDRSMAHGQWSPETGPPVSTRLCAHTDKLMAPAHSAGRRLWWCKLHVQAAHHVCRQVSDRWEQSGMHVTKYVICADELCMLLRWRITCTYTYARECSHICIYLLTCIIHVKLPVTAFHSRSHSHTRLHVCAQKLYRCTCKHDHGNMFADQQQALQPLHYAHKHTYSHAHGHITVHVQQNTLRNQTIGIKHYDLYTHAHTCLHIYTHQQVRKAHHLGKPPSLHQPFQSIPTHTYTRMHTRTLAYRTHTHSTEQHHHAEVASLEDSLSSTAAMSSHTNILTCIQTYITVHTHAHTHARVHTHTHINAHAYMFTPRDGHHHIIAPTIPINKRDTNVHIHEHITVWNDVHFTRIHAHAYMHTYTPPQFIKHMIM
jgi:hypothetical protein